MKRKSSRAGVLATLDYPVKVEVRAAEFEPNALLPYVDASKLRRGNHKIEVGLLKGGCCGRKVFAVIKSGIVVGSETAPCAESKKIVSKADRDLVAAAYKKVGRRSGTWKPAGVDQFFGQPAVMARFSVSVIGSCILVCIGDATLDSPRRCITCCRAFDDRISCTYSVSSTTVLF